VRNTRFKVCIACNVSKSMRGYYRDPNNADGFKNACKCCYKLAVMENRAIKPDAYLAWRRKFDAARKDKRREYLSRPEVRERVQSVARENYRLRKHAGLQRVAA
jgi:hypothetical protein